MKHTVTVTETDIAHGEPEDCGYCPIAIAMARVLGLPRGGVRVCGLRAELPSGGRVALPFEAVEFQHRFDRGEEVAPLTFETVDWRET